MPRPTAEPLMAAIESVLSSIALGSDTMPVGRGTVPDCPGRPYLILSSPITSTFDGSLETSDDDVQKRVQVSAVGDTQQQALMALDKARAVMNTPTIQTAMGGNGRRIHAVMLDLHRGDLREERGIPDPLFTVIDQYLIRSSPAPTL